MGRIKSRLFLKMFRSYALIILLCLVAYSGVIVYETAALKREQAEQFYNMRAETVASALDEQLMDAQNLITSVNSSIIVNTLYRQAVGEDSVDPYTLYQTLNQLQLQKALSGNLNINSLVWLIDGYDRAYTSDEAVRLSENFQAGDKDMPVLVTSNLNKLANTDNSLVVFEKEFLIYGDFYRYRGGSPHGWVCVLFDRQRLERAMDAAAGSENGWQILYEGEVVLQGGAQEEQWREFQAASSANRAVSCRILAGEENFHLSARSLGTVAISVGVIASLVFFLLAFFFSNRFYKPIHHISQVIGSGEERGDGLETIAEDVEQLVGERDGYMEEILTISPYAKAGAIHSLLAGDYDRESIKKLLKRELISIEKAFFLVAVVHIFVDESQTDMKEAKERIQRAAEEKSGEKAGYFCYEKDDECLYLIVNTDEGERYEDIVYEFYQELCRKMPDQVILTMGADQPVDQLSQLKTACRNAAMALDWILVSGRGNLYFYEEEGRSSAYYFPKEGTKQLHAGLKEGNVEGLRAFLSELKEKNLKEYDLALSAVRLLLSDLYMSTVKAVQMVTMGLGLEVQVEQPPAYLTFDEVEEYYMRVYQIVTEKLKTVREEKGQEEDQDRDKKIFEYVDSQYRNPDISLSAIAQEFHVSTKYVTALFKRRTGITYLQYVQEKRVAYSAHLLKHTSWPMEKVAKESGYTSLLTFRRNFKSIMDTNPSDFRDQL